MVKKVTIRSASSDLILLLLTGICRISTDQLLPNSYGQVHNPDKTVPIVMMTGYGSPSKISSARDFGVTEFLVKPFSAVDISRRILNIIKSPRNFIITPNYAGPDRRRKVDVGTSPLGVNNRTNPEGYKEKIKSNHLLQAKVGMGSIPEDTITKSQSIIDKNEINFVPIATGFLNQLREGLDDVYKTHHSNRRAIETLIDPVMQIKANANCSIWTAGRFSLHHAELS